MLLPLIALRNDNFVRYLGYRYVKVIRRSKALMSKKKEAG